MNRDSLDTIAGGDPRGKLVPVYTVIEEPEVKALSAEFSRPVVLEAVQSVLDRYRRELGPGDGVPALEEVVSRVRSAVLREEGDRLRPTINATGIILHTGLGRAVLPSKVAQALGQLDRCTNMQIDLETGKRAKRNWSTESLLCRITGAEAAMVVNNNAAATLLVLTALCKDREVLISQGQVIEIGGSFRMQDCIQESGAKMVRVGTTNRTHLRDYEEALTLNTSAALRVNPSNYRVLGFQKEVSIAELVTLKQKQDVLVIDDLGCGALIDTEQFNLPKEYTVQESLAAGADIACFSGDKLIGGAQSGIIVGKRELVAKIKKHPFTRMMRVCKLTDLVLERTLRLFLDPETLIENNPTLKMLSTPLEKLESVARGLKGRLDAEQLPIEIRVKEEESAVGGGSMPVTPLRTFVLAVQSSRHSLERLTYHLRQNEPPIIARIGGGEVLLDVRTFLDGDDEQIFQALVRIAHLD